MDGVNTHLFKSGGVRDSPVHSRCMKRLGLGVRGLLGKKKAGVEVAGTGTDRERVYLEMAGAGAIYLSESV